VGEGGVPQASNRLLGPSIHSHRASSDGLAPHRGFGRALAHVRAVAHPRTGRGACFDDIEELTGISDSSLQAWHHKFTAAFVNAHRADWLRAPTPAELRDVMRVYATKGMTGACGSVDCTHVALGKSPAKHRNINIGRDGKPSLTYEAVVGPDRFFHSFSPEGGHGAQNDKTTVLQDAYVLAIRDNTLFPDVSFELRGRDGKVSQHWGASLRACAPLDIHIVGPYLLCDNGYHKWRCLQCPDTSTTQVSCVAFAEALESARKDVECAFGILKVRSRLPCVGLAA
jgi:hypothetical protein